MSLVNVVDGASYAPSVERDLRNEKNGRRISDLHAILPEDLQSIEALLY